MKIVYDAVQTVKWPKIELESQCVRMYSIDHGSNHSIDARQPKLEQVETTLSELLAETLRRGFYGKAVLELVIQDGTIQHLRRAVERIEK